MEAVFAGDDSSDDERKRADPYADRQKKGMTSEGGQRTCTACGTSDTPKWRHGEGWPAAVREQCHLAAHAVSLLAPFYQGHVTAILTSPCTANGALRRA